MKSKEDYIRKGVELADGWSCVMYKAGHTVYIGLIETAIGSKYHPEDQEMLDALAAQLVRQVDALRGMTFETYQTFSKLTLIDAQAMPKDEFYGGEFDRTMNTIKAIIDSKVLEQRGQEEYK